MLCKLLPIVDRKSFFQINLAALSLALAAILPLTRAEAGQIPLSPYSSGEYVSDHNGSAKNNSTGLGTLNSTSVGSLQGLGALREHRSFLIFDTLGSFAPIVGANLQIGVTSWTTFQGAQPNPQVPLHLLVGQPQFHTAEEIATSHLWYGDYGVGAIFDDLGSSGLGSITVNNAPNLSGGSASMYMAPLPTSFVDAFNQARLDGTRYVTISITAAEFTTNYAQLGFGSLGVQLVVNSTSPVPEPLSVTSLLIGLTGLALARHRRARGWSVTAGAAAHAPTDQGCGQR